MLIDVHVLLKMPLLLPRKQQPQPLLQRDLKEMLLLLRLLPK
jgi:hypothetical protein